MNFSSSKRATLFLVLILSGFLSCEKDETVVEEEVQQTFDRKLMLDNIYDNVAVPAYETFLDRAKNLLMAAEAFSENPNAMSLLDVQEQWKSAKFAWEQVEFYDFGEINSLFLQNKIDKYPFNLGNVEDNLESGDTLDQGFVNNSGSTTKGLPVLEYLLFHGADNTAILENYTSGPLALSYRNYVVGLASDLVVQTEQLIQILNYGREAWVSDIGQGVGTSLNQLANNQVAVIEETIIIKVLRTLGLDKFATADPIRVDTPYAKVSYEVLKNSLIHII